MSKTIIYFDQNFISKMAIAKFGDDSSKAEQSKEFGCLYDLTKQLVDENKVICPKSIFHQLETEQLGRAHEERLPWIQAVVESLSRGVRFLYPWEMLRFQVFKAARSFLKLELDDILAWQDSFNSNPTQGLHDRGPCAWNKWQIDASPLKPLQYRNDREAEARNPSTETWFMRISKQKNGVLQQVYGSHIDDFSIGEAANLLDHWRFLDAPEALLPQFLGFMEIRDCPFIDIHCTLQAAFGRDPARPPHNGDALDTLIMASAVPCCDVIATTNDMFSLWKETKLNCKYPKRVYSEKSTTELAACLGTL
jgi:hypothetical protein